MKTRAEDNLMRDVSAGNPIKPWLFSGPFCEDVADKLPELTYFDNRATNIGRSFLNEALQEARNIMICAPREGDKTSFRGQRSRWGLVRQPGKLLAWGRPTVANQLRAAFLLTTVASKSTAVKRWRLVTRTTVHVIVALNGRIVFEGDQDSADPRKNLFPSGTYEHLFEAELRPGDNTLCVGMLRIGRRGCVCFQLEATDDDLSVKVPLAVGMSAERRMRMEETLVGVRLERDIFHPEHDIGVRLEAAPGTEGTFQVRLLSEAGEILRDATTHASGPVSLCKGADVEDGSYRISCAWTDENGREVAACEYNIRKVSPVEAPAGYDHIEERKRKALEFYSVRSWVGHTPNIWREVARYALGRYGDIDESIIRETCEFIAVRKDCSDFVIQGLLRMMCWERKEQRLAPPIRAMMKDVVLGFKYWVDEPGADGMWMDSENHRLLFHTAELLAG